MHIMLLVIVTGACSCSKSADTFVPKVSTTNISGVSSTSTIKTSSKDSTLAGTAASASAQNTGSAAGSNTANGSGSTGSSSGDGSASVTVGATNTIIIKVNATTYTFSKPAYALEFGLTTGDRATAGEFQFFAVSSGNGNDKFNMTINNNIEGTQEVTNVSLSFGSLALSRFDNHAAIGTTNLVKYDLTSKTKGTLQGTFTTKAFDSKGNAVNITGSYNISM